MEQPALNVTHAVRHLARKWRLERYEDDFLQEVLIAKWKNPKCRVENVMIDCMRNWFGRTGPKSSPYSQTRLAINLTPVSFTLGKHDTPVCDEHQSHTDWAMLILIEFGIPQRHLNIFHQWLIEDWTFKEIAVQRNMWKQHVERIVDNCIDIIREEMVCE